MHDACAVSSSGSGPPPRNTLPRSSARRRTIAQPTTSIAAAAAAGSGSMSARSNNESATAEFNHLNRNGSQQSTVSLNNIESSKDTTGLDDNSPPSTSASQQRDLQPFRCFVGGKAKRVRFYRNGDQYYKGTWYAISTERVRSLKALMEDLTRQMSDSVALPHGVRFIFTVNGLQKIEHIADFKDGHSYVCSSSDNYKRVDYENAREPVWCFSVPKFNGHLESASLALGRTHAVTEPNDFVFPRIITIIRNGVKPRKIVRHLLNKKTARTYIQVMQDITAVVKLDSGVVRKLFALNGRPVLKLADFFGDDDVFIAYGTERLSVDDFYVVSEESKRLYSSTNRRRRGRFGRTKRGMPARNESIREQRCGSVLPDCELTRQLPLLLSDRMEIIRLLGDGNTALVYEVIWRETSEHKALKVISRENTIGKEKLIDAELRIMQKIRHNCIVDMYDFWNFNGTWYLSLELVSGGDLFEQLCHVRTFDEVQSASLMRCLASALDYLHENDIVHRDVKPENLLIYYSPDSTAPLLKLADFGLACELPEEEQLLYDICGTPTYVAPEVLAEFGYGTKVDLWSSGVILYVLLCGFPPFQGTEGNQEQLFEQIMSGRFSFPSPIWDQISNAAKALVLNLLNLDVEERYSSKQILNYEWVTSDGKPSPEFEDMARLNVEVHQCAERDGDDEGLEETDAEYFFSRRASMDELSECSRSNNVRTRSNSFIYLPSR
uniref:non-specific serine/threonine protein kinase n=1 Tax=Steinernema glaseri TaxID=37863 RepID=A0A1I7Z9H1_9BILA